MMKSNKKQMIKSLREDSEYQEKFRELMKQYGVKSPKELPDDKKREFYEKVDKMHDAGENETDVDEVRKVIRNEIRRVLGK